MGSSARSRRGAALVIVDANDAPILPPEDLVDALRHPSKEVLRTVWGSELAYGRRVLELCEQDALRCTGVRTADGMDPIVDLIASRQAGAARRV